MEVLENTENDLQIDHRIIDCCVIALTHKVQNLRTCYTTKPVNTGMFMNFPWCITFISIINLRFPPLVQAAVAATEQAGGEFHAAFHPAHTGPARAGIPVYGR